MSQPFYFSDHLDGHPAGQTWQVERSIFDTMMVENAREQGVEVFGVSANKVLKDRNGRVVGIQAKDEHGQTIQLNAPMTIDASGRNGFAANTMGWNVNATRNSIRRAMDVLQGGKRGEGRDEGRQPLPISPRKAALAYPLHDDRISLGVAYEKDYLYRDGLKDLLP